MKPTLIVRIAACVVAVAGAAHAGQTLSSPTIYGAFNQDTAECIVRNVGKSPINADVAIVNESGTPLSGSSNCAAPIQPGEHCFRRVLISNGVAYACVATPSGNAKNVRANFVLIDDLGSTEVPIRSAVLR